MSNGQVNKLGFQLQSTLLSQPRVSPDPKEFIFQSDKQDLSTREPDRRASERTTVRGQTVGRADSRGRGRATAGQRWQGRLPGGGEARTSDIQTALHSKGTYGLLLKAAWQFLTSRVEGSRCINSVIRSLQVMET